MSVLRNRFKARLREHERQIGLWQALANPYTTEICAGAGFDWLLFDGEHAPMTIPSLLAQLQAVAPYPVDPVARIPVADATIIKQYLDIGFQTLLVPFVNSAEQARQIVSATRYAPEGIRGIGVGLSRAARWNRVPGYLDHGGEEICVLVQIETREGLDALDEIAAVDGVDGIFIGPADLSAAMGYRGQPDHPAMIATISEAIARVLASGKPVGTLATDPARLARAEAAGCSFIAAGTDVSILSGGCEQLARSVGLAPAAIPTNSDY